MYNPPTFPALVFPLPLPRSLSHHGGSEEDPAGGGVETGDNLRADILQPLRQNPPYQRDSEQDQCGHGLEEVRRRYLLHLAHPLLFSCRWIVAVVRVRQEAGGPASDLFEFSRGGHLVLTHDATTVSIFCWDHHGATHHVRTRADPFSRPSAHLSVSSPTNMTQKWTRGHLHQAAFSAVRREIGIDQLRTFCAHEQLSQR